MRDILIGIFLLFILPAQAEPPTKAENTNVPFLLFYQPLFEMENAEAKSYVNKVRQLFISHPSDEAEWVLQNHPTSENCSKKKLNSCSQALYLQQGCIPEKQKPSQFCFKNAKNVPAGHFKEPTFNRIEWNKFAIGVNYFCNKHSAKVCEELATLHDQYMNSYLKLMAQRRAEKEARDKVAPVKVKKKGK